MIFKLSSRFPSTFFILTIVLFIALTRCQEVNKLTEIELLEQEVMAIHDSVMPQMTKIYYDKERLEQWLEQDTLESNEDFTLSVKNTIRDLKYAEDAMWKWMSDYADIAETIKESPDSTKNQLLLIEKKKIIHVRNLMLTSMEQADSLYSLILNKE